MEAPNWYFEPSCEADFPYVDENQYYQTLDQVLEVSHMFGQLVAELYDDCKSIDRDIVHGIICKICDELNIEEPEIKTLKV